ncbi:PKD domain-containing protein [Mucilaginibacter myungsuensis]|uniref:PKD domain-containing protein n=1 Tax=Mucilaginibacter myungsuensis TaxID=649104 RepID=A0A929PW23_9SPHI|nr:PKD domain-containing protein [Mucilaginibacter myungsuensis]MBE9660712.1 PKD domain-containing protein [Mucilaginibacter myungsuensis]MDN3600757.1 PKD domain-containing protein [Mucilaginibacter myungsuensis]
MLKEILRVLLFLTLGLLNWTGLAAQSTSSKGTEFWTCYMQHIAGTTGNSGSSMILYITSDVATSGKVEFADGTAAQSFNVVPNTVTFVTIPANQFLSGELKAKKGIHITALKPIAVYAHIYASSVSGATLLLPVNTMGKSYLSLNYTQLSNSGNGNPSYSIFDVIGTEDDTEVEITPIADLTSGKKAGVPFVITLAKGELFQGLSATDLTGTKIRSISTNNGICKKIAVFSGSSKIGIGCYNSTLSTNMQSLSSDNLFQQVYPTSTWGKNYITVALKDRNYDIYRIVLSEPDTKVTLNGVALTKAQFVKNLYHEFSTIGAVTNVISADKPIQVVQYTPTQNQNNCVTKNEAAGDPEMIYLSPIEQGLDHVTLYSTGYHKILASYINVVLPTDAVATFTLDGADYSSLFRPVANNPAFSYAQIPVSSGPQTTNTVNTSSGTHNIKASKPFNAIAYGFGSAESYGYAAGTNLVNLNEFVALKNSDGTVDDDNTVNGCINVPYKLQLTLPYRTTNIKWDFKDNKQPIVDAAPVPKRTVVKGSETLYVYEYSGVVSYPIAGDYTVVATVFNPFDDDCGSSKEIQFDFNIAELPVAAFEKTDNCVGNENTFTDNSNLKNSIAKAWIWDFGDGTKGNTANPKHTYAKPGNYDVTLTIVNENGCQNTSVKQTVHIWGLPKPVFEADKAVCVTKPVTFTDRSTSENSNIVSWVWDFGDGSALVTRTAADPLTHTYNKTGTYHITLTLVNAGGCTGTITQSITVNQMPVVDFVMPDACLSDNPQFKDASSIPDNSNYPFTYLWDFGDPKATAANPNTSTERNPFHKYTEARDASNPYKITLTVTTKNGCSFSVTKSFVVNGDQPKALFRPNASNTYCSTQDVLFDNLSTVNFGKITKVIWYFDVANHPNDREVYTADQFPAGNIFKHNYGSFDAPATKRYTVRMEAYSGESCVSQSSAEVITVKANPSATLSQIGGICVETLPVKILPTVKYGITGTHSFTGPGISQDGTFDPSKTGPGTFTINYNFKANNGCDYTEPQRITVYPTPTVNAGSNFTMLEGASVTMKATAGSDVVSYRWNMANGGKAVGLDRDNVLNPVASPIENSTYVLTVTTANGCSASSKIDITVLKLPVVPNTFTPNNDGINDTWQIKYLNTYENATVTVFDRSGTQVYFSKGYGLPWDGTFKGAALPLGTYYYIIDPGKLRKQLSGSVTILR